MFRVIILCKNVVLYLEKEARYSLKQYNYSTRNRCKENAAVGDSSPDVGCRESYFSAISDVSGSYTER